MKHWEIVARIAPIVAPALLYAGSVWFVFNVLDERFPKLGTAVLDWLTRRDRTLYFGPAIVSISGTMIGGGWWSARRVLFVLCLSSLSTISAVAFYSADAIVTGGIPYIWLNFHRHFDQMSQLWTALAILCSFAGSYLVLTFQWKIYAGTGSGSVWSIVIIQIAMLLLSIIIIMMIFVVFLVRSF
jgi:hypothetical protein